MLELELSGLDGSNPLGFMAAVGVLASVDQQGITARLSWRERAGFRPVLHSELSREALLEALLANRDTWVQEPVIGLSYAKSGKGEVQERDLKAPPDVYRRFLFSLLENTTPSNRRSVDYAATFGSEMAKDNNGAVKPSALHFLAGQQRFLDNILALRDGVTADDLSEAAFGPWLKTRSLPVMGWDATDFRNYALRATNPSKDKKTGVPGADWLAFVGWLAFPVAPYGSRLKTTACRGGWKTGEFVWPLWQAPLSLAVMRSVVGLADVMSFREAKSARKTTAQRLALNTRGINAVFCSRITRSDQGGYGSVNPAERLA